MNARPLLIIIAALVLVLLVYLAFSALNRETEPAYQAATTTNPVATTTTTPAPTTPAPNADSSAAPAPAPNTVTVTYGPNGFSPASITIPAGTTVTWVNQTNDRMWVGSDEHPTHTEYGGTSLSEHCAGGRPTSANVFDQCSAGASYSFTFTKTGTFGYHNHLRAAHDGTVTVTSR